MDALILAAGRGTRLQPLTNKLPKPLIEVHGLRLIEIHLFRLAFAGFNRVIINLHHLGERIKNQLGDGDRFGLKILYSEEVNGALETAGGIVNALALIESELFVVVSADVLCDYPMQKIRLDTRGNSKGHLIMVNNPTHHPQGDFLLDSSNHLQARAGIQNQSTYTFSGLACFSRAMFESLEPGKRALRPVLEAAMLVRELTGEVHNGIWSDIGTLERLNQARACKSIGAYIESIKHSIS